MNERYRRAISRSEPRLKMQIMRYFFEQGIAPRTASHDTFFDWVADTGLCQADLVLCLLRMNSRPSLQLVERLIGRRITHCPPCLVLFRGPSAVPRRMVPSTPDDRRVLSVVEPSARDHRGRRRLLARPMYSRLAEVKPGMTLAQALGRGLTRRDIRIALKRGYFVVEAA